MACSRTPRSAPLLAAAGSMLAGALLLPASAAAQQPLPAVLPEVVFLVEESNAMNQPWAGDPTLTSPSTRWTYVRQAIESVVQSAPTGMNFGVVLTENGSGNEPNHFERVAYPGMSAAAVVNATQTYSFTGGSDVKIAESYSYLLEHWADQPWSSNRNWNTGPFRFSCSELVVIVIGFSTGEDDATPNPNYHTSDGLMSTPNVQCNDSSATQGCFLDNVARFARATFNPTGPATTGSVTTGSILIDAAVASGDAYALYDSTAQPGNGDSLFYAPTVPGGVATSIWGILTNAFEGEYSNAAISVSPSGDTLFASYFEVEAGHPLYKGHLLAWQLDNNPASTTYGEILPSTGIGPYSGAQFGEIWDAGQLLASRQANSSENNQNAYNPVLQRNGYTAYSAEQFYSNPMPMDNTEIYAGSDLVELLVDEQSAAGNPNCLNLTHDFNYDCGVDITDAQILVDFLRGVATATFLSTGLPRGPWKMGDTGNSRTVVAESELTAIATENHFINYRIRIGTLPGMAYIASNAGMIHAFNLDTPGHQGSEYWFYVPRAKLSKNPDDSSLPEYTSEYDGHQADDLMRTGQTYVNDGRLSLEHVWLDGYMNGLPTASGLPGCSGPGYFPANADGVIDSNGCEWHRILVWSGGYGSRHHYALDVTIPTEPKFLWERTDESTSGGGEGRAVGAPAFASFWDNSSGASKRRWVVAWGSGSIAPGVTTSSSNSLYPQAGIYVHDMDSTPTRPPTTYNASGFSFAHSAINSVDADAFEEYQPPEYGMFGTPAIADLDGDASVDVAYVGDSMGYVFKILFNEVSPNSPTRCQFGSPATADTAKHIYYPPTIFYNTYGELNVFYGSGSPYNIYEAVTGGIYGFKDPTPFACSAGTTTTCANGSTLFNNTTFFPFTGTYEKIVGAPTTRFGRMFFATHIPGSDLCTLGNSRLYGLDVNSCEGGLFDDTTDSYNVTSNLYTEVTGLISEPVFANGQLYALNIGAGGMGANSVIDNFNVTPNNYVSHVYMTFRHVF